MILFVCINIVHLSHVAAAITDISRDRISLNEPVTQTIFQSILDDYHVPYKTIQEYGEEVVIRPGEYGGWVDTIIKHDVSLDSSSEVHMLFELGKPKQAIALLKKLADKGDADAQVTLGLHYVIGRFVEKNYNKARDLYRAAIIGGNHDALVNLAVLYEYGWGVVKDEVKAFKLYRKAAHKYRMIAAMCKVGHFYEDGKAGLPRDVIRAKEWYAEARSHSNLDLDCARLR